MYWYILSQGGPASEGFCFYDPKGALCVWDRWIAPGFSCFFLHLLALHAASSLYWIWWPGHGSRPVHNRHESAHLSTYQGWPPPENSQTTSSHPYAYHIITLVPFRCQSSHDHQYNNHHYELLTHPRLSASSVSSYFNGYVLEQLVKLYQGQGEVILVIISMKWLNVFWFTHDLDFICIQVCICMALCILGCCGGARFPPLSCAHLHRYVMCPHLMQKNCWECWHVTTHWHVSAQQPSLSVGQEGRQVLCEFAYPNHTANPCSGPESFLISHKLLCYFSSVTVNLSGFVLAFNELLLRHCGGNQE
jgi:hypothetical protein